MGSLTLVGTLLFSGRHVCASWDGHGEQEHALSSMPAQLQVSDAAPKPPMRATRRASSRTGRAVSSQCTPRPTVAVATRWPCARTGDTASLRHSGERQGVQGLVCVMVAAEGLCVHRPGKVMQAAAHT